MSQSEQIISALKSGRTITPIEALNEFGCFRLSARVYDLKEMGWPIHCDNREVESGKYVGHYSLDMNKEEWPE